MTWSIRPKEAGTKERLSPQFGVGCDGPTSSRLWLFPWDYIKSGLAEAEAMGYPTRSGAGVLTRNLPEFDFQRRQLWASNFTHYNNNGSKGYEELTIDGLTQRVAKWDDTAGAIYRVDYSWRPFPILTDDESETEYDRFVEIQEDDQSDYISPAVLNNGTFMKWADPGVVGVDKIKAITTIGKLIPYSNLTMVWHQVPYKYFPLDTIRSSVGKVSKADLGSMGEKNFYQAGTLLFCGCRYRIQMSPKSQTNWIDQAVVSPIYHWRYDGAKLHGGTDIGGPNSFPCFLKNAFGQRLLISDTGIEYAVGARDGHCIYPEFDPVTLFTVS